jgi:protein TonB
MSKNDWIGAGASACVHILLLLIFLSLTTATEPLTAGYVEVEFGTFNEGRPIQRAVQPLESETEEPKPDTENRQEPVPEKEVESKPVDLPDQPEVPDDPEDVRSPDVEEVAPDTPNDKPDPVEEDVISGGPTRAVAGQEEGSTGRESGTEGPGLDEQRSAPYVLEGIDRIPLRTQLPDYDEKVNAVIQVRITVDPRGRIVRVLPLRKGNPTLEQAVMQALRQWVFNPLRAGAPQENQTGTITFRFRLE